VQSVAALDLLQRGTVGPGPSAPTGDSVPTIFPASSMPELYPATASPSDTGVPVNGPMPVLKPAVPMPRATIGDGGNPSDGGNPKGTPANGAPPNMADALQGIPWWGWVLLFVVVGSFLGASRS